MTRYLGIDPGLKGGFAVIAGGIVWASPFPLAGGVLDPAKLAAWWTEGRIDTIAIVEQSQSMPGQGVAATFSYGAGYGMILGVLAALRIRTELVRPTVWKKLILAGTAKDKEAAIAWCRRSFPDVNLIPEGGRVCHDGMADALCLADYGRRTYKAAE